MLALPLPLLFACAEGPLGDARAYPAALAEIARDPAGAARACRPVQDPALRADCVTAGAEALAPTDAAAAWALCEGLPEGQGRDECAFQVAEGARDPARCPAAGRFAEDCRMHLWSREIQGLLGKDVPTSAVEGLISPRLADFGFEAQDMRPWSAAWRVVLSAQRPLDRASCASATRPELVESCRATALIVYQDRLNQLRDKGLLSRPQGGEPSWCEGGELPPSGRFEADPELEAMLRERRARDLCR